jgi:hypothetical protein
MAVRPCAATHWGPGLCTWGGGHHAAWGLEGGAPDWMEGLGTPHAVLLVGQGNLDGCNALRREGEGRSPINDSRGRIQALIFGGASWMVMCAQAWSSTGSS